MANVGLGVANSGLNAAVGNDSQNDADLNGDGARPNGQQVGIRSNDPAGVDHPRASAR